MGQTITQKIISHHSGEKEVSPGEFVNVDVSLALANDITAPIAIDIIEKENFKLWNSEKIVLVLSHYLPAKDIHSANQAKIVRDFAKKNNIKLFFDEANGGIEHSLLPDEGYILPSDLIVGADSHSCTYGALGAFSTGVGSTDIAAVFVTGKFWMRVPESIKFIFEGTLPPFVGGKDLILLTIGKIGVDGALYKSMEFCGSAIKQLSIEERLTITNMSIEAGAKSGIIEPDEKTIDYVKSRTNKKFEIFKSDPDAVYSNEFFWDVTNLQPQIAKPHSPENVVGISEVEGQKVDVVFIGSCTNGRLSDLKAVAKILANKKVSKDVRLIIIPSTKKIFKECLKQGLIEIFLDAGAIVSTPTCGPCLGAHMGVVAEGEVCLSTSNRNFQGRMGDKNSNVYLSNPQVAAASAITGKITNPINL